MPYSNASLYGIQHRFFAGGFHVPCFRSDQRKTKSRVESLAKHKLPNHMSRRLLQLRRWFFCLDSVPSLLHGQIGDDDDDCAQVALLQQQLQAAPVASSVFGVSVLPLLGPYTAQELLMAA